MHPQCVSCPTSAFINVEGEEKMWCSKCNNELSTCTCPDIDERMKNLAGSEHFVYRMCLVCGKHYERCKCVAPQWTISDSPEAMKRLVGIGGLK